MRPTSMRLTLCAVVLGLPVANALADDTKSGGSGGDSIRDITYAGISAERVKTNFDNVGAAFNLSAVAGVRIPTIDWIGAELLVSQSIIPGKNDNASGGVLGKAACVTLNPNLPPGCTPSGGGGGGSGGSNTPSGNEGDFTMTSIGLAVALRSPGRFYATGKFGYRYLITNFTELDDKRSGTMWSAGLGWRWGQTLSGVEALYTDYGAQVRGIGLGIVYGFGGGHY